MKTIAFAFELIVRVALFAAVLGLIAEQRRRQRKLVLVRIRTDR